ncbi:chitin deacetylase, partial [Terramyces sp. JEL0728]
DTNDAVTNGVSVIPKFDQFMAEAVFGTISLEHDLHIETASKAPYGMNKLSKSAYVERTISQCTGQQAYGRIEPFPSSSQPNVGPSTVSSPIPSASPITPGPPSNPVNNYFTAQVTVVSNPQRAKTIVGQVTFSMDYPTTDMGTPLPPSPIFNAQYKSVMNIRTGPSVDWEKSTCRGKTDWALTYDDGPSQYTPGVVEQLTKHNFRGTFFVVGAQAKKYPQILIQAYKAGMEIGVHTWSHPVMTSLSNEQIVAEIMYTFNIIKDIIGVECRYFRAPYGTTDTRLRGIAQALGFVMIRWNRDTGDATTNGRSLKPQFDAFMKQPVIGTISLEHDLHAETAELAYYGMDKLSKSPYTERTISECTGEKPYGNQPFADHPNPSNPSKPVPVVTQNPVTQTSVGLKLVTTIPITVAQTTSSATAGQTPSAVPTQSAAATLSTNTPKQNSAAGLKASLLFLVLLLQ